MLNTLARPAAVLDHDALRRLAPSVFAETPSGRMSGRYRLVPTIEVVGMLADRGDPGANRLAASGAESRVVVHRGRE